VLKKSINLIMASGPEAFLRTSILFIITRAIMLIARMARPFGVKLPSLALWILKRQSPEESAVALFKYALPALLSGKSYSIIVPNYLEKAFCNLLPLMSQGSKVTSFKAFTELTDIPDWIIINEVMIRSIRDKLLEVIENFDIEYHDQGFYLLRNRNIKYLKNLNLDGEHASLKLTLISYVGSTAESEVIHKHGFHFKIRPSSMDSEILDEVKMEYFSWLDQINCSFDLIVDIGAQIGGFSIMATEMLKEQGVVTSFEPEPKNVELLKSNVLLNELETKIKVYDCAVSDREGKSELFISTDNTGGNKLGVQESSSVSSVIVKTVDALKIIEPMLKSQNLLKIDVEGWEYPILKRLEPILPRFEYIVGELQRSQFGSSDKSIKILERAGFQIEKKGDDTLLVFMAKNKRSIL
jgi:FkbM family methyltransferase